jgi:hypothetical protein
VHVGHGVALWIPTALPSCRKALVIEAITSFCIASKFSRLGPTGPGVGVGGTGGSGVGGDEALELRLTGGRLPSVLGLRSPGVDGSCPAVPFRLEFTSPEEGLTAPFFFLLFSLSGDGTRVTFVAV